MRPPGLAGEHVARGMTRAHEHAGQVDVHDLVPVVERDVDGGAADRDAGVVDQDVDLAVRRDHGVEHVLHRALVGDVHRARLGAAVRQGDRLGGVACRRSVVVGQHDDRADARERGADGLAEPVAAAGDHRDLAVQAERRQGILQIDHARLPAGAVSRKPAAEQAR